jgi:linoleoyl-CoA desaturase
MLTGAPPSFASHSALRAELIEAVDAYFARSGLDAMGGARMLWKAAAILGWTIGSYALLLFVATSWWSAVPLAVSLGLALPAVGFNVMHDANHGSYSRLRLVNAAAAATLDLMGGSSYLWRYKHNVLHHTFTNVDGFDDDIDLHPMVRLSEGQPRYWFHRFQVLYWVPLFVFFIPKWTLMDDFVTLARGKVGRHPVRRPRGAQLALLVAGKIFYYGWAVVVPLLVVPVTDYLGVAAIVYSVWGLTIGLVATFAHTLDHVAFVRAEHGPRPHVPQAWVEHQLATTSDFARDNRLVSWFVGGLNFQVEHHLFPRVSHVHYRALAPIVREVCRRHGVSVHDQPTVRAALGSHLTFMIRMGSGRSRAGEPPGVPETASRTQAR